jgi:molybdopterin-containing oxidoreductase family iron-sulfur binding subunit
MSGPVKEVPVTLEVRRRGGSDGKRFWTSLEDLADSPGFLEFLHREFPEQASEFQDPAGRRNFMKVMGASLALAGLTGCTVQPEEKIVAYVKSPEDMVPGRPQFFASAMLDGGYARPVLVESHHGRPTKIEGNPEHPASLGATDAQAQAAVLDLYDPDRSQTITHMGEIRTFSAFVEAIRTIMVAQKASGGSGVRLLTETVTSPTLADQIQKLLAQYPQARWHQWDPAGRDNVRMGAKMAFGEPVEAVYRLDRARVVLSLDADFLAQGPGQVRYTRDFANRRRLQGGVSDMLRLYAIESSPGLTGSLADHRLPVRASAVEEYARAIAAALGVAAQGGSAASTGPHGPWIAALVKDLQRYPGEAVAIPGDCQPAAVHALAHAINERLGAAGKTVVFTAPVEPNPIDQLTSLRELAADMEKGTVSLLVILGGNPVYTAPFDLQFAEKMDRVALRVHLGQRVDETAQKCHWHINETHALEAWSDARAYDGTLSVIQPLIAPLYGARSAHEVVNALRGEAQKPGYELVRAYWQAQGGEADFESRWRRALHDGFLQSSALPERSATVTAGEWMQGSRRSPGQGIEVMFRPDPSIGDGRYANNGWLQELPKNLTKLTWDNAVILSKNTAKRLDIAMETTARGINVPVVEVKLRDGRSIRGGAWIQPGHPDEAVTLHLGYGRTHAGKVGNGAGFNAYVLRSSQAPWHAQGAEILKTGESTLLACTQDHWRMEGRDVVRAGTLDEYKKNPDYARERLPDPPRDMTLYPNYKYDGHAWGMAIDLNACTGCNACVVACVAENNIPVVGREQVAHGREMHWMRVDRYYEGEGDAPDTYHQPMLCHHCENAPCEVVCPVAATVHSEEGLNDMIYNRCVGTRYCSNNCPYKVRRFNFFLYADWDTPSLKLQRNPDVTVRSRGVMEKCTYCVQRINLARVDAKNQNRSMTDGDVVTACQAACPAQAIVFGDVNDPNSQVSKWKNEPRNYGVLTDLNTRPRTTYLAAVKNPNPEMPNV